MTGCTLPAVSELWPVPDFADHVILSCGGSFLLFLHSLHLLFKGHHVGMYLLHRRLKSLRMQDESATALGKIQICVSWREIHTIEIYQHDALYVLRDVFL